MPSKETVRRQRSFGGAVGVVVLGLALVYHFFPRVFHVEPSTTATHRAMNLGPASSSAPALSSRLPEPSEVDAGPPLTLAPTDVVVARLSKKNTNLPEQLSADTPEGIAAHLSTLLEPAFRVDRGKEGREWILRHHHWKPIISALLAECEGLVANRVAA